jgi:type IV pilus biogenesis protein CpaD/CtpE
MRAMLHLSAACLIAALTGCSNMIGTADPLKPLPEDPNPFTFKQVEYPFAVRFTPAADAPTREEMTRLQDFLQTSSARPGDKVTISGDNTPLGQLRTARVRDVLTHAGLESAPGVDINLGPNTVGLVVKEAVAIPPKCGDWPIFAGDQPSNAPSPYLGCALKTNLYEMVVDKRDLAVGRTPGPADAEPGMRAVQTYREGKSPLSSNGASAASGAASGSDAGDSASGAATAAGGMANSGTGASGGSDNGQ